MGRPLQLLKEHRVGIWCRRAAWIILIISLIRVALAIYSILMLNNNTFTPTIMAQEQNLLSIATELTTLVEALFYFFILYAAAVVIEHLTGSTRSTEEDDLELEVEDLDEEVPERLQK
jgi:hypothetical protein